MVGNHHNYDQALLIVPTKPIVMVMVTFVDMLVSSLQVTLFTVVAGVDIERPAPKAA